MLKGGWSRTRARGEGRHERSELCGAGARSPFLRRGLCCALLWLSGGLSSIASADEPVARVEGPRVWFRDVFPGCTGGACKVDLGAAAPPGSSRLFDQRGLRLALRQAGASVPKGLPSVIRVQTLADRVSPERWLGLVKAKLRQTLPRGVTLLLAKGPQSSLLLPRGFSLSVELPATLTRRAGKVRTSVVVVVSVGDKIMRRVPTVVQLQVDEEALAARARKGESVRLRIVRRAATISAQGIALRDVQVGQRGQFRVERTGRVLLARLISRDLAEVVEAP